MTTSSPHAPRALLVLAAASVTATCGTESRVAGEVDRPEAARGFESVTTGQWDALTNRRIFFGHQSVGGNIVDGIQAVLHEHPEIPLKVEEAEEFTPEVPPGLYHARIGVNGTPMSKVDAFDRITAEGPFDLASLKFCYLDVSGDTDPDALFAEYQRRMDELRARDPSLVLIHMTMPLTTVEGRMRALAAKVLGRTTDRDLNAIRNRYNALLRSAYAGREPVFDLAEQESTLPDGSRSAFRRAGSDVYVLHAGYTVDGGHLNEVARRRVAEAFLAFLADLD